MFEKYNAVSEYFKNKLEAPCQYIEDKATMYLTIDGEVYKIKKLKKNDEYKEYSLKEITELFEETLFN